ncbi:hypothetical protein BDV28DRAFT_164109 [Aspergillus coremiiformis]|uniref:FAD/NAD(P)-binding domain-containing protein n=1 Tax=Aspergillus coremiiformis TaxID=138285 RepID=A0A5N6ZA64_9EURO|nr:hypothetical protein BDV28DRAFT_164109 [Aspergillus coremiiformis]
MATPQTHLPSTKVIIVGAGFSGLVMAYQLKQQLKCNEFVIYDRAASLGGTWLANTYPGCGVDVPAPFYSLSFAPNPDFTSLFPKQHEVLHYMNSVASKFDISRHVKGDMEWIGASFQESTKTWLVKLRNVISEQEYIQECNILVSAVGALTNPKPINIHGIEHFQGKILHTARWDHDVALADKNVIVIGNGSSATQLIPAIAPKVQSITQFIRSPQYYFPGNPLAITPFWRNIFRYVPGMLRLIRLLIFLYLETSVLQFNLTTTGKRLRGEARERSNNYIKRCAPRKYWNLLLPTANVGCKRRVFDHDGYIPCLNRDNVHLTDDPITSISHHSVQTQSGQTYPADVIVLANGFTPTHFDVDLRGRHGRSQHEHWKDFGYIEAYESVAMSGFPNFFYVLGPNSGRGYTSAIYSVESASVEPKLSSERAYNDRLHTALGNTVNTNACRSWYIDDRTGKNWAIYPWGSLYMWYTTHVAGLDDWIYDVPQRPARSGEKTLVLPMVMSTVLAFLALVLYILLPGDVIGEKWIHYVSSYVPSEHLFSTVQKLN